MKKSEKEAIVKCLREVEEGWSWLRDNPTKEKHDYYEGKPHIKHYCPACEYVVQKTGHAEFSDKDCALCPLKNLWAVAEKYACENHEAVFYKWRTTYRSEVNFALLRSGYANEIVKFARAERERIESEPDEPKYKAGDVWAYDDDNPELVCFLIRNGAGELISIYPSGDKALHNQVETCRKLPWKLLFRIGDLPEDAE